MEVHKEAYELGKGLAGILKAVQDARKDGWDTATDLPMLVVNAVRELLPAVEGVEKLPAEAKANGVMFGKSLALPLTEVAESLV